MINVQESEIDSIRLLSWKENKRTVIVWSANAIAPLYSGVFQQTDSFVYRSRCWWMVSEWIWPSSDSDFLPIRTIWTEKSDASTHSCRWLWHSSSPIDPDQT